MIEIVSYIVTRALRYNFYGARYLTHAGFVNTMCFFLKLFDNAKGYRLMA